MDFKSYSNYKDSGVEWLGEVPEHWEISKIKFLSKLISNKTASKTNVIALENIESWTGKLIHTDSEFDSEAVAFEKDDVLFGKLRPYLAKVYLAPKDGQALGDIYVLRPNNLILPNFLYHSLLSTHFIDYVNSSTNGTKMPRANWDFIGVTPFALPPLEEQDQIVSFLDSETSRIDNLISKQEKLIEKLEEHRKSVISHAVTKGLNPDAPMKDSGVEWLGEVPEHWNMLKSSYIFKVSKGKNAALLTKEYCATREQIYPVYSGQTENSGLMGMTDSYEYDCEENGGILSTTVGAKAMSVKYLDHKFNLSQNCMIIFSKNNDVYNNKFYYYFFQPLFHFYRNQIPDFMQPSFRMEDFYSYKIVSLTLDEQKKIVEYLDFENQKFDNLISKQQTLIEKLKEYRTSIISHAVTGKIDVRDLVA